MSLTSLPRVTPDLALPGVCRSARSLSTFNFELSTSFFSTFQPSNVQTRSLSTTHCSLPTIFFRINTYETSSKCCRQRTYRIPKSFRFRTYKKHGGWGVLWLTRHATKHVCPERPSGVNDLSCYPIRKGARLSIPQIEELPHFAKFLVPGINQIPHRLIRQRH